MCNIYLLYIYLLVLFLAICGFPKFKPVVHLSNVLQFTPLMTLTHHLKHICELPGELPGELPSGLTSGLPSGLNRIV